jgi:hypothetical protein
MSSFDEHCEQIAIYIAKQAIEYMCTYPCTVTERMDVFMKGIHDFCCHTALCNTPSEPVSIEFAVFITFMTALEDAHIHTGSVEYKTVVNQLAMHSSLSGLFEGILTSAIAFLNGPSNLFAHLHYPNCILFINQIHADS